MRLPFILREQDTGQSAGSNAAEPPPTDTAPATTADDKRFTQAELESELAKRLDRKERQAKEREEKARKEAEERTLAEQGEYRKLAEQRAQELADAQRELEGAKETATQLSRYKKTVTTYLEAQRKALPAPILSLLDKLDPVDQLEWIAMNAAELTKPSAPDINAGARGNGTTKGLTDAEREQATTRYRLTF